MDNFNIKIIGDIEQDPCVSNKSPMYLWRHSTEPPAFNYIWIKNDAVYYHNGHEWLQVKDYSFDISSPSLDADGNELCYIFYKGNRINPITVSSAVGTSKGSNLQQDLETINETLGYCSEQIDDLSDVAFSGNYNDLINKPTIPSLEGYATLSDLSHKVDKVTGKQLSTEDFTTALKQKLINLSNYDDTELSNSLKQLQNNLDGLMNGNTTTAINSFNEIITFLNGIEDTQSLQGIIASIQKQINLKQPFIEDLEKIKRGAGLGSTALQEIPSEYITEEELQAMNFSTVEQLEGKQDRIDNLQDINLGAASGISALHQLENLSAVAKSGDYNDLSNKPTIPNAITESTISNWGFTKNTGTYIKPSDGIPIGDLKDTIQKSLGKADTAIQEIKTINGQSLIGSGDLLINSQILKFGGVINTTSVTFATSGTQVNSTSEIYYFPEHKIFAACPDTNVLSPDIYPTFIDSNGAFTYEDYQNSGVEGAEIYKHKLYYTEKTKSLYQWDGQDLKEALSLQPSIRIVSCYGYNINNKPNITWGEDPSGKILNAIYTLVIPENSASLTPVLQHTVSSPFSWGGEYEQISVQLRNKSGQWVWAILSIVPSTDTNSSKLIPRINQIQVSNVVAPYPAAQNTFTELSLDSVQNFFGGVPQLHGMITIQK